MNIKIEPICNTKKLRNLVRRDVFTYSNGCGGKNCYVMSSYNLPPTLKNMIGCGSCLIMNLSTCEIIMASLDLDVEVVGEFVYTSD